MEGTVTIVAARPGFGRAGKIKVSVDGELVGRIRQGSSLDIPLAVGTHRFRVSSGGSRSKNLDISVSEGGRHLLTAGVHQGLVPAVGICAAGLGYFGGILFLVPLLAILIATPGTWFYLRASAPAPSPMEDAEPADAAATTTAGEMWWMNDPNLAKRYRKP